MKKEGVHIYKMHKIYVLITYSSNFLLGVLCIIKPDLVIYQLSWSLYNTRDVHFHQISLLPLFLSKTTLWRSTNLFSLQIIV